MSRSRPTFLTAVVVTALVLSLGTGASLGADAASAATPDASPSAEPTASAAPTASPLATTAPAPTSAPSAATPPPGVPQIPSPGVVPDAAPQPGTSSTGSPLVSTRAAEETPVTGLPSVSIQLPANYALTDLNASKKAIPADPAVEPHATIDLVDPANEANNTVGATLEAIKGRGNFTWTLEKKPYQIKFDASTSVLGMAKAKTWILLANHADPSLLRSKLAYDLAGEFGLPGSADSRFIDLTVDGQYLGNYLITEKVEVKANRLELTHPSGVLLELDNLYGSAEETYFRTSASRSTFVLKDGVGSVDAPLSAAVSQGYADVQAHIARFEAELYAADPDWTTISSMIDVESFIKYYFVVEAAASSDVSQSSVYMWRDGPDDVLHAGPVWDFDIAFGNYAAEQYGGSPVQDYVKNARYLRAQGGNDWFMQLFRNVEFVSLANELFEAELEPKITALVGTLDGHAAAVARSGEANFGRWSNVLGQPPVFSSGRTIADTWAEEVAQLRSWLSTRVAHLSAAYGSGMPILRYASHVSAIGWQQSLTSGLIAGTSGRGLQVEALDIALLQNPLSGTVQSRAHVQGVGWTPWQGGDTRVGTTGRGLQLEAVQFQLTDELAARYNISYRVHVQAVGWMDWVSNGFVAGTSGRGLQIEAIQIRLLDKTAADPVQTEVATLTYESHVQAIGWMPPVTGGAVTGTSGRGLQMEALLASATSNRYTGGIEYRAHVQANGWMAWSGSWSPIGTVGQGLRMEAVEIRLTGELAEHYSIRYSGHVQGIGWMAWSSDGQTAGTTGEGRRLEALNIELVPKP